jgi:hypothetical protein
MMSVNNDDADTAMMDENHETMNDPLQETTKAPPSRLLITKMVRSCKEKKAIAVT